MIYLDSCALIKLIREEPESPALREFLDKNRGVDHVTSQIAQTEIRRVVWRANHNDQGILLIEKRALQDQLDTATEVLESVSQIVLDRDILELAGSYSLPFLRTLDAIHLASAAQLGLTLTKFVTYDKRLMQAAKEVGMEVVAV